MPRFIEGQDRHQVTLLPESLDEFIAAQCLRHEAWHHSHWPGRVRGARRMSLA